MDRTHLHITFADEAEIEAPVTSETGATNQRCAVADKVAKPVHNQRILRAAYIVGSMATARSAHS